MIAFPTTTEDISRWLLVLSLGYILMRGLVAWRRKAAMNVGVNLIADALFFAGSVLVILGVWNHAVLTAIGDLTTYLVLAGIAGITATVKSVFKEGLPVMSQGTSSTLTADTILSEEVVARIVRLVQRSDPPAE